MVFERCLFTGREGFEGTTGCRCEMLRVFDAMKVFEIVWIESLDFRGFEMVLVISLAQGVFELTVGFEGAADSSEFEAAFILRFLMTWCSNRSV